MISAWKVMERPLVLGWRMLMPPLLNRLVCGQDWLTASWFGSKFHHPDETIAERCTASALPHRQA
jgi:hypothetical protein